MKAIQAQAQQAVENVIVDNNNFSIHRHTNENLEYIFRIAKIIAEKFDPDNPHSYPTKEQLSE